MKLKKTKIVSIRKYKLSDEYVYDVGMGGNFPFQLYNESQSFDVSQYDLKMLLSSEPKVFFDGETTIELSPQTKVLIKDSDGIRVIRAYSVDESMEILDWESREQQYDTNL